MQNTRLNSLVGVVTDQIRQLFRNPWRRVSLMLISLLFGFFLGNVISTSAGQRAELDVVAASFLVILFEVTSRIIYSNRESFRRSLPAEMINALKIGMTYSFVLEAFKLGS
jgi:hypothetical protein